jgi:hypothetical protein
MAEHVSSGIFRRSGRYPWSSEPTPIKRSEAFIHIFKELKTGGKTETEIAEQFNMPVTLLRSTVTQVKDILRKEK